MQGEPPPFHSLAVLSWVGHRTSLVLKVFGWKVGVMTPTWRAWGTEAGSMAGTF